MTSVLPARSHLEVVEYVALQQCPCGAARPFDVDRLDRDECRLEFSCPRCGAQDSYRYELTGPPAATDRVPAESAFGPAGHPSRLIGPGGWAQVAAQHAMVLVEEFDFQQAAMEPRMTLQEALALLEVSFRGAAAAAEALRCLPDGAERLSPTTLLLDPARPPRPTMDPQYLTAELVRQGPAWFAGKTSWLVGRCLWEAGLRSAEVEQRCGFALSYGVRPTGDPIPARSHDEAQAWMWHSRCECGGHGYRDPVLRTLPDADGPVVVYVAACMTCARPREYVFRSPVGDGPPLVHGPVWGPDGSTSALFSPADFLRIRAMQCKAAEDALARDDFSWRSVHNCLRLAAAAPGEALNMMPAGVDVVGEAAEQVTREMLERARVLTRQKLVDFLVEHPEPPDEDDDEDDFEPPDLTDAPPVPDEVLRPRSFAELKLYHSLHPCACGTAAFDILEIHGGRGEQADVWFHTVRCAGCGRLRRFNSAPPPDGGDAAIGWAAAQEPSTVVDAGQWLLTAEAYAALGAGLLADTEPFARHRVLVARSGVHPIGEGWQRMELADEAVREAMKFIPLGGDRVPADAFWTEPGRALRDTAPQRFTKAALEAEIDRISERRSGAERRALGRGRVTTADRGSGPDSIE